mgnify:CR=1 FL=1
MVGIGALDPTSRQKGSARRVHGHWQAVLVERASLAIDEGYAGRGFAGGVKGHGKAKGQTMLAGHFKVTLLIARQSENVRQLFPFKRSRHDAASQQDRAAGVSEGLAHQSHPAVRIVLKEDAVGTADVCLNERVVLKTELGLRVAHSDMQCLKALRLLNCAKFDFNLLHTHNCPLTRQNGPWFEHTALLVVRFCNSW